MFEQLIVNEPQLPIHGKFRFRVVKVRNSRFHIESDLKFWRVIRVGNHIRRDHLYLWN